MDHIEVYDDMNCIIGKKSGFKKYQCRDTQPKKLALNLKQTSRLNRSTHDKRNPSMENL